MTNIPNGVCSALLCIDIDFNGGRNLSDLWIPVKCLQYATFYHHINGRRFLLETAVWCKQLSSRVLAKLHDKFRRIPQAHAPSRAFADASVNNGL